MFVKECYRTSRIGLILISIFLFINFSTNGSDTPICEDDVNFNGCCKGYKWNFKTKKCEECTSGYTGLNCTSSCPHPTYGVRCQGYCDCTNVTCDVSKGCLYTGENISKSSMSNILNDLNKTTRIINKNNCSSNYKMTNTSATGRVMLLFITVLSGLSSVLICANIVVCIRDKQEQREPIA